MKKFITAIPNDFWILLSFAFFGRIFSERLGNTFLFLTIGYLIFNYYITQKRYGCFRFFLLYTPFLKKDRVYIMMAKNPWKPNVGKRIVTDAKSSTIFMYEMEELLKEIPSNVQCICYTHETIIKAIEKHCTIIKKKPSYKGSLKTVMRYLDKESPNKKEQFYYVKFIKSEKLEYLAKQTICDKI